MKQNIFLACSLVALGTFAFLAAVNVAPLVLLFPSPQVASTILCVMAFSPTAIFVGRKLSDWMNDRVNTDTSGRSRPASSDIVSLNNRGAGKEVAHTNRLSMIARALFQRITGSKSAPPVHGDDKKSTPGFSSTH